MTTKACFNKTDPSKTARRMFVLIILVSFAPLILVTGFVIEQFESAYKASVHAQLQLLVENHAGKIDEFLSEKQRNLFFLAGFTGHEMLTDPGYLKRCLNQLQANYGSVFEDLGVIEASGLQSAYAGPFDLVYAEYGDTDWFREAMQRSVYISDVFTGYRGYPHFVITIRQKTPESQYLLRATIGFESFTTLIEHLKIGKTGSAFIVNAKGRFQTQPNPAVVFDPSVLKRLSQESPSANPSPRPTKNIQDIFGDTICLTVAIKNGEWMLVYLQDPSDAFCELAKAKQTAIIIFLLGGGCIIIMAFYLPTRLLLNGTKN